VSKIKINLLLISLFFCYGKLSAVTVINDLKEDFFFSSNKFLIIENDFTFIAENSIKIIELNDDFFLNQDSIKIAREKLIKRLNRRKKIIANLQVFLYSLY